MYPIPLPRRLRSSQGQVKVRSGQGHIGSRSGEGAQMDCSDLTVTQVDLIQMDDYLAGRCAISPTASLLLSDMLEKRKIVITLMTSIVINVSGCGFITSYIYIPQYIKVVYSKVSSQQGTYLTLV